MSRVSHYFAEVIVKEWGEEDRYVTIGPFSGESAEDVEFNLMYGDREENVIRVWEATE